jgi:hypothetical protein
MQKALRRATDERGVALVLALIVMGVLSGAVTVVVLVSSSSGRSVNRSSAVQNAYSFAETGIANAMSVLHGTTAGGAPVDSTDSSVLPAPPPSASAHRDDYPSGCTTNCLGYVLWGGTLNTATQQWTITSWGYVNNPTGPGTGAVVRKLTAVSQVQPSLVQQVNNHVWNYIYSWRTSTPTTCDVTIANNVTVSAPLYIEGNLCLSNGAHIAEQTNTPPTPTMVVVKGKTAFSPNSSIGFSNAKISEAHMVGGCGSSLTSVHACTANGGSDPVYTRTFDNNPTTIAPPTPDYTTWYNNANPGPKHACGTGSSSAPTWDPDTTLDLNTNGNAGTLNLTPATNYTCYGFNASGNKVGELSWNAATKTLTISGAVFFDGNVTIANQAANLYTGMGTLYATGYAYLDGKMCGARTADLSNCDFSAWDPNSRMLIIVAHGNDGSGNSITFDNNARYQGGLYCQNTISFQNNSTVEGPVMAGYLNFVNNVVAKPFPVITALPLGTPGNPNVYADAQPPVQSG